MKFGSSWIVKAPCKVNGVECPERVFGCRNNCKRYAEYEKKFAAFKANMHRRKRQEEMAAEYLAETKARYMGIKHER